MKSFKEMKEHQRRFIDEQKRKHAIEALEEKKDLDEEQKDEPTEVQEDPNKKAKDPPEESPPPQPQMNERILYGTRYGAKYHFRTDCKGLNDQPNHGKSPCQRCQQRTQQILEAAVGSASSSSLPSNEIGFEVNGFSYHEVNCYSFL